MPIIRFVLQRRLIRGLVLVETLIRNFVACCAALLVYCVVDAKVPHGWAEWLLIPALYLAVLWANRNLFRSETGGWAAWAKRAFVSALLFPIYAFTIKMMHIWLAFAIWGRLYGGLILFLCVFAAAVYHVLQGKARSN